jgi:hypothetical protein
MNNGFDKIAESFLMKADLENAQEFLIIDAANLYIDLKKYTEGLAHFEKLKEKSSKKSIDFSNI